MKIQLKSTQSAKFTFYHDGEYTVVKRDGTMLLVEDDAGNRMWLHSSFIIGDES